MKVMAKDVTGEVYETPDISKELLFDAICEAYGITTEEEAADIYRVVMNSMREWDKMDSVILNVGTIEKEDNLRLLTKNLVWLRVMNPIVEWEDDDDKRTLLDDPRFWS